MMSGARVGSMRRRIRCRGAAISLAVVLIAGMGEAAIQFIPGPVAEADSDTVKAVMEAFDRADEAMRQRDLDKVMAFYSEDYNYHGLTKADVRTIWKDLFARYRELGSSHMFSLLRMTGSSTAPMVEITCSGSLWGVSESSNRQVPLDSWYQETHILVKEHGAWKIRGNVGETPKVLPFGTAPHPLF